MQELKNNFKINGQDYKFQVDTALDADSENPVQNKALYRLYRNFAAFENLGVSTDMSSDTESDNVPTVGAVEKNFGRVEYNTRMLKDFTAPNVITVYDAHPSYTFDNANRFEGPASDSKGLAYYYITTINNENYGNIKYSYDENDSGGYKHADFKLYPYNIYYVKYYNTSSGGSDITSGFYQTNKTGILQLNNKLSV